jgi:hypothetical protein
MDAFIDIAASTSGFPGFSNTANQALIGQQYDLLLLLSLIFYFLFLVISS